MKKFTGINRNKYPQFHLAKQNTLRKKNRFKSIGKDQDLQCMEQQQTHSLITSTTTTSPNTLPLEPEINKNFQMYEQAKYNLGEVTEFSNCLSKLEKKITAQCKLRITAFKQSQAKKYDENITNLSTHAIQHLLAVEKTLSVIKQLKGSTQTQEKYYRNMEKSIALQLREATKQLRSQQKKHFDRLKAYQKGTVNTAIELSETQKQKMKSDIEFSTQISDRMIQQQSQSQRDSQINQLIQSINKLSTIYRQLNQVVAQQGSIIDRIDVNIEQTLNFTQQGNKHLINAQDRASNPCAVKCILVLVSFIIVLAVILGIKYSK